MEWVETTGRTLEEAKDAALDQLGVDEDEAEFEVLEDARTGLFGRLRSEARVRARVRPTAPRSKDDRRDRRRRRDGYRDRSRDGTRSGSIGETTTAAAKPAREPAAARRKAPAPTPVPKGDNGMDEQVSLAEQGELARTFVIGLLDALDVDGDVSLREVDEETIEVAVEGDDLGLLIGPRGQTLSSLQEMARTVVQRHVPGRTARILVDVAGYRQRRREALERFARQVADEVRSSGQARALEPMPPADRKVVHDTVNELAGVGTISEGEEPRRRVVIVPEAEAG